MPKEFTVLGVSHHSTPIEIREQLAVTEERLHHVLKSVCEKVVGTQMLCLSTCNRVEFYAWTNRKDEFVNEIRSVLSTWAADKNLEPYVVERVGIQAVEHAFRVASSLDSMVVGEAQILGQFKEAFRLATEAGAIGTDLERIVSRALAVAKRVRSETQIGSGSVSISSVACDLAQKIFGSLLQKQVLLVGAGEMAEAAARQLLSEGARLSILNRSPERAEHLAFTLVGSTEPHSAIQTGSLGDLEEKLLHADVVIASTGAEKAILAEAHIRQLLRARKGRPIFFIDIGVPRNIESNVSKIENVFLYNLDDLQLAAEHNARLRKQAAEEAEKIIEDEIKHFQQWHASQELSLTISAMRERVLQLVKDELRKQKRRMARGEEADLDYVANAIVGKLMHQPLTELKKATVEARGPLFVEFARRMFGLAHRTISQESREKSQ